MTRPIPCRARAFIRLCVVLMCFFPTLTLAQTMELMVTVTNETCSGNGALAFSVTNAAPAPPVNYKVYKLPNVSTPIFDNTATSVNGLTDGTYKVVATQTVNGNTNTAEQQVEIEDQVTPLVYQVGSQPSTCADGIISINVTQGYPVSYEILTGPVTHAPQTDSMFNGLPAGTYSVRVNDNCGEGIVKTITVQSAASVLNITGPNFPDIELPDCDHITLAYFIDPQDEDIPMVNPITGVFTLYPPGGGTPLTFNAAAVNISPTTKQLSVVIPFYYDTNYYFDLVVTDGCGATYNFEHVLIRQKLTVVAGFDNAGCGQKFLFLNPYKYVAPYTITFTEVPDDFDPVAKNPQHPGPFMGQQVTYGGDGDPVPVGTYVFTLSDACGRSESISIELEEFEPEPEAAVFNSDCVNNLGRTEISVPGFILVGGYIQDGPPEFTDNNVMPFDLSGYINEHNNVEVGQLPPGTYQFEVIDDCGTSYFKEVIIPDFSAGGISPITRPDCTPGRGCLRVGGGYSLNTATITVAPAAFTETLPYDASAFISETGTLYMDNLPPGTYKVKGTTNCTPETEVTAVVPEYIVTSNEVEVIRHCGSFDVMVSHESNATALLSFWLQKLVDPINGKWGSPSSNTPYPEGTVPDVTNSKLLTNNEMVYSIIYTGKFRILKVFQTFGSGEPVKICTEVLEEFEFYDDLTIVDIKSLTCTGDTADIEVTAIGAEPLNYTIIEKNGDPFILDNGNNNIFLGLESAAYLVKVSDPCGNTVPRYFNVADLPSLVNASTPPDPERCDEDENGTEDFNLADLDAAILDGQTTNNVTLTYHATLNDAQLLINPLPDFYTAPLGSTQVFARVTHNLNADCMAITAFHIKVRPMPVINMKDTWSMCEGESVLVTADSGFESYLWSTGETTRSITVSEPGLYTITVENEYGCSTEKEITVIESYAPEIRRLETEDWTDDENVITVILRNNDAAENFEYSLDGIHYQDSNTFTGLVPGHYSVFVRDKYSCGMDAGETYLLTYPKFFTPNGDTVNEYWRIAYSMAEPNMHVYIMDRYGKLITAFGANSQGWDGTYNGARLPSTDYWFIVIREDGKEYKGHFSMIR